VPGPRYLNYEKLRDGTIVRITLQRPRFRSAPSARCDTQLERRMLQERRFFFQNTLRGVPGARRGPQLGSVPPDGPGSEAVGMRSASS
jgi:hypothetical protein